MASPPFLPDETKPGSSDLISLYPAVEQTFRDIIESWLLIEHNTNGTHKQVTLDDISTPTIAANLVGLWHESGVLKTRFAGADAFDILTSNTGLKLSGGTLTGDLVLDGAPDADLKAATKAYVDAGDAAGLESPALTGNPTAPTASAGDNDTSIANTAFVTTAVAGSGFAGALFHIQDRKSSGTDGGTFSNGEWRRRDLNSKRTDEISGASLSANVITLPAGTYYVDAVAPGFRGVSAHLLKLRNTSDSTDTLIGTAGNSEASDNMQTNSVVTGRFTIAGEKTFELQHRSSGNQSTTGFGQSTNFGVDEVYADIKIWKVS